MWYISLNEWWCASAWYIHRLLVLSRVSLLLLLRVWWTGTLKDRQSAACCLTWSRLLTLTYARPFFGFVWTYIFHLYQGLEGSLFIFIYLTIYFTQYDKFWHLFIKMECKKGRYVNIYHSPMTLISCIIIICIIGKAI